MRSSSNLNPAGASEYFLGFLCHCLSSFTTAKITFTCIELLKLTIQGLTVRAMGNLLALVNNFLFDPFLHQSSDIWTT